MMAKMFYTLDETKVALGKNEEEIKQLVREGKLREFRDGPRLMFKADQIETLKGESGGGNFDQVDLGPSDSGAPIGLVDSRNASGTSITLGDTDATGGAQLKDDTASGTDLGLSGSLGGIPSPGRAATGSGLGGSASGGSGVTVFRPDEVERVDPMAQTAMSASLQDQVNLEGVGSGSGLLDLTRESDDTSLGAELLDDIAKPGAPAPRRTAPTLVDSNAGGTGAGMAGLSGGGGAVISAPIYIEAPDPMAPALAAASLAAAAVVIFGGFIVMAAVLGYYPAMVNQVTDNGARSVWFIFAIGLVLAIVLFVIGLIAGKSRK